MARTAFESLHVYGLAEQLADRIWEIVLGWDSFAKRTVGGQLVDAVDSIGANIAEGVGRGPCKENQRFVRINRGSLNETKHFLRRAYRRDLVSQKQVACLKPLLDELAPRLNAYLKSIGPRRLGNARSRRPDDEQRTTDNGPLTTDN
jgi:four helix bundle protein